MFQWLKRQPVVSVGLDIQSHTIRLLQLQRIKKQWHILKAACHDIPKDTLLNGQIKNIHLLTTCLKHLVEQTNTQGGRTAIALPWQLIESRQIPLSDLKKIINKKDRYFDYCIYTPSDASQPTVTLITADSHTVNQYINVVTDAGLKITAVDVDRYALCRTIAFTTAPAPFPRTAGILFCEQEVWHILLIQHHHFIADVSFTATTANTVLDLIYQFFEQQWNQYPYTKLPCLYVIGMTEPSESFRILLQERLHLPVVFIHPFAKMTLSNALNTQWPILSSQFIIACGLALRHPHARH